MDYLKLSDICYIISKGKNSSLGTTGNINMLTFPILTSNGEISDYNNIAKSYLENPYLDLKTYNVENKDIIFSINFRNNLLIKQLNIIGPIENTIYSSRVAYIRVNPEKYNSDFLFQLLNSPDYIRKLENEVYSPGVISQISIERLKNFEVPNIPLEQQKEILQKQTHLKNKISTLTKQLDELFTNF